jgi:CDGSH-type Zn-finger protein
MKPRIGLSPNGPYRLVNDPTPRPVDTLRGPAGQSYSTPVGVSLCRCGGSKNKPFCDGTHSTNGFRDKNLADPAKNRRDAYAGKSITIFDNRAICAHAGFCTDGLKEVFKEDGSPWIDADGAAVAKIIETIEKCPSGALSYAIDGNETTDRPGPPRIDVTKDGPYAVSGGVELAGMAFGDGASKEHYTLCRCGASKNKPFCDGTHWSVGFHDPA